MTENTKTAVKKVTIVSKHQIFADEIVNSFKGQPLTEYALVDAKDEVVESNYMNIKSAMNPQDKNVRIKINIVSIDENGNQKRESVTEADLRKKWATFASIEVEKDLIDDMLKNSRETKEPNPYIGDTRLIETFKMEVMENVIWQNVIDNKREKTDGIDTEYEVKKTRQNRIENYRDSRVVCHKMIDGEERFYISYVVLRYLSERVITDTNGNIVDKEEIKQYLKKTDDQKEKSQQKMSEKTGIAVEFLPQIRQMKMSNIKTLKVLNKTFNLNG